MLNQNTITDVAYSISPTSYSSLQFFGMTLKHITYQRSFGSNAGTGLDFGVTNRIGVVWGWNLINDIMCLVQYMNEHILLKKICDKQ